MSGKAWLEVVLWLALLALGWLIVAWLLRPSF